MIQSRTGCVRETLDLFNDETDCSTGRVRETLLPMNDKTDARTGRVRFTPHPTYDQVENPHLPSNETDYSKGRLRETPDPTYRFQHGAFQRDSPHNERPDSFYKGTS